MPRGARARGGVFGLGLCLAGGLLALSGGAGALAAPASRVPMVYHNERSFRIPFQINKEDRSMLKEVQLWVSSDRGYHWEPVARTTPTRPAFKYHAPQDGEYWFAVRTLDVKGRLYPPEDDTVVEPSLKVVVDTTMPWLDLQPQGRRGSQASVRWELRDEHLNPRSLLIEYQPEGGSEWRQVPLGRRALIGEAAWDAGTADPLKVRASVSDLAGNVQRVEISLPDGTASGPPAGASDLSEFNPPPPISPVSSGPRSNPDDPPPLRRATAGPGRVGREPAHADDMPASPSEGNEPGPGPGPGSNPSPAPAPAPERAGVAGGGRTQLIPSPRFKLKYAVEDAGPNGPAAVELWVTRDGGRTWSRMDEDPDRTSPYEVDLGGEGTFGLTLVARSASGLGDPPPGQGDPPQMWVEVDATPPAVQLDPPRVGTGSQAGKVSLSWRGSDLHLAPRSASLWYRADQSGARWQLIADRLDGSGVYLWDVPADAPPRLHVRVELQDTVGNRGSADTTSLGGPIVLDRARPRSRIIGLEPSARNGAGTLPLR